MRRIAVAGDFAPVAMDGVAVIDLLGTVLTRAIAEVGRHGQREYHLATMSPDRIFSVINALPMPLWLLWLLAPRSRLARRMAEALWPFALLGLLYAALLGYALATGGPASGTIFSLRGVMALFSSPWGVLAGWMHYLCFDLFVGRWIMRDAPDAGYRIAPVLLLTLLVGPVGLLAYLALRRWLRAGRPARG